MKVYKTEKEMMKDVVNGSLTLGCDVRFEFNMSTRINITARNITARDITARDINAREIFSFDISSMYISKN